MIYFKYGALLYISLGYVGYIFAHNKIKFSTFLWAIPCSLYGPFAYFTFSKIANVQVKKTDHTFTTQNNDDITFVDIPAISITTTNSD